MGTLFPEILRVLVDATMNVLLMLSLLQPKYGKKITAVTMFGIWAIDVSVAVFWYLSGNLTQLAKWLVVLFTILCIVVRPLFQDSFMQWLFSYITVLNIDICTIVLSLSISNSLPYRSYAIPMIRLVLYLSIFYLLNRYVRPIYRQMMEHWHVFFFVAASLVTAFTYYIVTSKDIVKTLSEQAVPMNLLVLVTVAAYLSIFYALKTISREYALREANLNMQNNQELLHLSAHALETQIKLMDEIQQKSRIEIHDRRHLNHTLLELLEENKTEEVIDFLKKQFVPEPVSVSSYCENTVINAAVCYYIGLAESHNISTEISLDIPDSLPVSSIELAMIVSNLMENAIHTCEALEQGIERYIRLTCRHLGSFVLEISNPCDGSLTLNDYGHPVTKEKEYRSATKGLLAFEQEHDANVMFLIEDGVFWTRVIIL
jgi:signal transduction histidine kinase